MNKKVFETVYALLFAVDDGISLAYKIGTAFWIIIALFIIVYLLKWFGVLMIAGPVLLTIGRSFDKYKMEFDMGDLILKNKDDTEVK